MLRSYKLAGSLYIGIAVISAGVAIFSRHDAFAAVSVAFLCIGVALLGSAARQPTKRHDTSTNAQARRHGHVLPP